jgi:DNA-binding NarL/FixJ family response regulator
MAARILIADDDPTIRRLLRRVLEDHAEWNVCAEAVNGLDAVAKANHCTPDVVVMDLAMPRMNGLEAARRISQATPGLPMLLLTVQELSNQLLQEARNAGFRGAISKSTGTEVVKGIQALLRSETYFSPHDPAVAI